MLKWKSVCSRLYSKCEYVLILVLFVRFSLGFAAMVGAGTGGPGLDSNACSEAGTGRPALDVILAPTESG